MRMHTHKWVRTAHSGCCSLFIHSCWGLHAWLGIASFFSPLSPALPFPKELVDHKPTTLIVQHTGLIQTKGTASLSHISAFLRHQQTMNCFPLTAYCCFTYLWNHSTLLRISLRATLLQRLGFVYIWEYCSVFWGLEWGSGCVRTRMDKLQQFLELRTKFTENLKVH